jgi:hypothetical protein
VSNPFPPNNITLEAKIQIHMCGTHYQFTGLVFVLNGPVTVQATKKKTIPYTATGSKEILELVEIIKLFTWHIAELLHKLLSIVKSKTWHVSLKGAGVGLTVTSEKKFASSYWEKIIKHILH